MNAVKTFRFLAATALILSGCANVPDKNAMQRLDSQAVRALLVGNTVTRTTDYGRWAAYYAPDGTGAGSASGSWGSQKAILEYTIATDGMFCERFDGTHEWTPPGNEYCYAVYQDAKGAYYYENTKDTRNPNRVGNMSKFTSKPGDAYDLIR